MGEQDRSNYSEQTRWMLCVRDAGDREAFAMLFDFFAPRLKAMAMRAGASGSVAEEVVQDVMLRVWRKSAQFDPERAQVSGWIYQIARNRQSDLARRAPRPLPEDPTETFHREDPSQVIALEQEAERLRTALTTLPPKQREMVEKVYLGELTHQEISRQIGVPLGTVKSRLRLALERLRHELKGLR